MGWISWLCPGIQLKRWLLLFTVGVIVCAFSLALLFNSQVMGMAEELLFRLSYLATGKYGNGVTIAIGLAGHWTCRYDIGNRHYRLCRTAYSPFCRGSGESGEQ